MSIASDAPPAAASFERPAQRSGISATARDSWVEAARHLRVMPRNPELIVFAMLWPVMFLLLFSYVLAARSRSPATRSRTSS